MKKICIILLAFIFGLNYVYALEMCTPSDEYLEYQKLSDE